PNGCHVCEVEIDPETGAVKLVAYVVVDDVGTVINPLTLKGQVHGGLAQGIGQILMEEGRLRPPIRAIARRQLYGLFDAPRRPDVRHHRPRKSGPDPEQSVGREG